MVGARLPITRTGKNEVLSVKRESPACGTPASHFSLTGGELQRLPVPESLRDVVDGFTFCATLQLRTPLRILQLHGTVHNDPDTAPPAVSEEAWAGIWIMRTKTFRDLGVDVDDLPPSTMASEFGQVPADGGECLHYLKAIRGILERRCLIGERTVSLERFIPRPQWTEYWIKSGGAKRLTRRFFPTFLSTVPRLAASTQQELWRRGLRTPNLLAQASDDELAKRIETGTDEQLGGTSYRWRTAGYGDALNAIFKGKSALSVADLWKGY